MTLLAEIMVSLGGLSEKSAARSPNNNNATTTTTILHFQRRSEGRKGFARRQPGKRDDDAQKCLFCRPTMTTASSGKKKKKNNNDYYNCDATSFADETGTTTMKRRHAMLFALCGGCVVTVGGGCALGGSALARNDSEEMMDSRTMVSRAMRKFETNDVEGAAIDFDALIEKSPGSKPYLWQRGIALYYIDEFREAEKQFRLDTKVNPNDTEEAAWAFLSQMRKGEEGGGDNLAASLANAREEFVELTGRDSRAVMGSVLKLYKTGDEEGKKTLELLSKKPADSTQSASDAFYASLYLGLYNEAIGNVEEARYWMKKANGTPYGQKATGDFMTSVARVHLVRRKWDVDTDDSDRISQNNNRTTGGNVEVVSTHAFDSVTRRLERFPFPESISMRLV